ncbi:hypothetical protein OQA88_9868 [Cercophora sp. LCS_1]
MADITPQESDAQVSAPALEPLDCPPSPSSTTNSRKRKASSEHQPQAPPTNRPSVDDETLNEDASAKDDTPAQGNSPAGGGNLLSKNQLKRLRRQEAYAAYKEERKVKRKEKRHAKADRKRAAREEAIAAGVNPASLIPKAEPWRAHPVAVSFIIDCDFESYMREPEIVSLSSQVTRSYAMTRKGKYQAHLFISSWKGKLRQRYETVLSNTHLNWKGVKLLEGDFVHAAREAKAVMEGPSGGEVIDVMAKERGPGEDGEDINKEVVYLTSESPYTLDRLEPNTSYVIGGLVDRNREKGLCYKRAQKHKVRTAKLPIGEYMVMQDRYVLTTNQVVEIMVKWMECGDWGEAFMAVIPKRKGGTLKAETSRAGTEENENAEEGQEEQPRGDAMMEDAAEPQLQTSSG